MKIIDSLLRNLRASLLVAFVLCGLSLVHVPAQNSEILSVKPPVYKSFDSEKNESTVSAMLIDPAKISTFDLSSPVPDLRLKTAEYTYRGTQPSRPSVVSFVIIPREKFKTAPSFSLMVDGTLIQEGEATLREMCCVQINGVKANPQYIVVSIPFETLERFSQVKKIEIKLASNRGRYSLKLNDFQMKSLTALKNTIK